MAVWLDWKFGFYLRIKEIACKSGKISHKTGEIPQNASGIFSKNWEIPKTGSCRSCDYSGSCQCTFNPHRMVKRPKPRRSRCPVLPAPHSLCKNGLNVRIPPSHCRHCRCSPRHSDGQTNTQPLKGLRAAVTSLPIQCVLIQFCCSDNCCCGCDCDRAKRDSTRQHKSPTACVPGQNIISRPFLLQLFGGPGPFIFNLNFFVEGIHTSSSLRRLRNVAFILYLHKDCAY